MYKILQISFLFAFFLSTFAFACEIGQPDDTSTLPSWITKAHNDKPFDFLHIAIETAQLRMEYTKTAIKILQSEKLTLDQKKEFAETLDPTFQRHVQYYTDCPEKKSIDVQSLNLELPLFGLPRLSSNSSALEYMLADRSCMLTKTLQQWRFLVDSLQAYKQHQDQNFLAFTNQLLREILAMQIYACADLNDFSKSIGALGYFKDEVNYVHCLLDNLMLHCCLVSKLDTKEIEYNKAIRLILNVGFQTDLGNYFALSIFDHTQTMSTETISQLDSSLPKQEKSIIEKSSKMALRGTGQTVLNDEQTYELMQRSHMPMLLHDRSKLSKSQFSSLVMFKHAQSFVLTPDCLTFGKYLEDFQQELKEEKEAQELDHKREKEAVLASFAIPQIKPKQQQGKRKSKNQAPKIVPSQQPVVQLTTESLTSQPSTATVKATPSLSLAQINLAAQKEKKAEKLEAEQEAKRKIIEEKVANALRKQKILENPIEHITVGFTRPLYPSMDELELYYKIWLPDSQRKDLSWMILMTSLKNFGWTICDNKGGSSVVLTPPSWFWHLNVTAPAELKIHFQPTKIMIHKAHKESQTPMPAYVIGFLHAGLGNNIGLSELVVKALIAKLPSLEK